MYPDVIFQILLLYSRPMMSHHVTAMSHHVTAMSHASSSLIKRKRNIKSRKIDKRKMLVSKAFHNTAMEAINYDNQPCLPLNSLWNTLHSSFNTALYHQVDINILDEIENKQSFMWTPFSKEEFKITLGTCSNSSTPGLDKLSWRHLKSILMSGMVHTGVEVHRMDLEMSKLVKQP